MTAEQPLAAVPEAHDPVPAVAERTAGRRPPRPSATRGASLSRANHVRELGKGRASALRHGLFAIVANLPEVTTEVALQYAARPGLDPIRDRRLVEQFDLASIHLRVAAIAIQAQGLTEHLGAFISKQATLVERLERTVDERDRRNLAERGRPDDGGYRLGRYRSGGPE